MFDWMTPLLVLGYSRPLEPSDLYRLQPERSAENTSSKIMTSFEARRKAALLYNEKLANGDIGLGWRALWWNLRGNRDQREKQWRGKDGQRKGSLKLAMNDCVKRWFWIGGFLRLISDLSEVCSSLVVKVTNLEIVYFLANVLNAGNDKICDGIILQPSLPICHHTLNRAWDWSCARLVCNSALELLVFSARLVSQLLNWCYCEERFDRCHV